MRKHERPTKNVQQSASDKEVFNHPAYGMVGMSHVTGGASHLFGSDIRHGQRIRIRIQRAELHRGLSNDWFHGRGLPIVEIELSHTQFAEFITNPNRGDGFPRTLTAVNGEMMPSIDQIETKQETFRREIRESASEAINLFKKHVAHLGEMIEAGTLTKKELRALHHDLTCHVGNLPSNMAFTVSQAEEALERATTHAKIELEATVNHHINRIGLDAARQIGLTQPHHQSKEIEK